MKPAKYLDMKSSLQTDTCHFNFRICTKNIQKTSVPSSSLLLGNFLKFKQCYVALKMIFFSPSPRKSCKPHIIRFHVRFFSLSLVLRHANLWSPYLTLTRSILLSERNLRETDISINSSLIIVSRTN